MGIVQGLGPSCARRFPYIRRMDSFEPLNVDTHRSTPAPQHPPSPSTFCSTISRLVAVPPFYTRYSAPQSIVPGVTPSSVDRVPRRPSPCADKPWLTTPAATRDSPRRCGAWGAATSTRPRGARRSSSAGSDAPTRVRCAREMLQREAAQLDQERRHRESPAVWRKSVHGTAEIREPESRQDSPRLSGETPRASLWISCVTSSDMSLSEVSTLPTSDGISAAEDDSGEGGAGARPSLPGAMELKIKDVAPPESPLHDAPGDVEFHVVGDEDKSGRVDDCDDGEPDYYEESWVLHLTGDVMPTLPSTKPPGAASTSEWLEGETHYIPFRPNATLPPNTRLRGTVSSCSFVAAVPPPDGPDRFRTPRPDSRCQVSITPGWFEPTGGEHVPNHGREFTPAALLEPTEGLCELEGDCSFPQAGATDGQNPVPARSYLTIPGPHSSEPSSQEHRRQARAPSHRTLTKQDSLRLPSKENLRALSIIPRWAGSTPEVHRGSGNVAPTDMGVCHPKAPRSERKSEDEYDVGYDVDEDEDDTFLSPAESTVAEVSFPLPETKELRSQRVIKRKPVPAAAKYEARVQRDDRAALPSRASRGPVPARQYGQTGTAPVRRRDRAHPPVRQRLSSAAPDLPPAPTPTRAQSPDAFSCAAVAMAHAMASYQVAVPQSAVLRHRPGVGAYRSSRPGQQVSSSRSHFRSPNDEKPPTVMAGHNAEHRKRRAGPLPRAAPATEHRERREAHARPLPEFERTRRVGNRRGLPQRSRGAATGPPLPRPQL